MSAMAKTPCTCNPCHAKSCGCGAKAVAKQAASPTPCCCGPACGCGERCDCPAGCGCGG